MTLRTSPSGKLFLHPETTSMSRYIDKNRLDSGSLDSKHYYQ
jgi:hypothetical protein